MATTGTTPTVGTTPTATASQSLMPVMTPLVTPGVQPVSAYQGGNQTPSTTPTNAAIDPLAFTPNVATPNYAAAGSGLPTGFTMGTGADYGSGYYNGQKIIGTNVPNPSGGGTAFQLANGQFIPYSQSTDQAIQSAANQNYLQWANDAANPVNQSTSYSPDVWSAMQASAGPQATYNQLSQVIQSGGTLTPEQEQQWNDATAAMGSAWQSVNDRAATLPSYADTYAASVAKAMQNPTYLQGGQTIDQYGNPVPGGYNALQDYYRQAGVTPGVVNSVVMDLLNRNPGLMTTLPQDQYDTLARTLASTQPGFNIPARASDTSGGGNVPQTLPALTAPQTGGSGGGATGATGGSGTGSTTGQGTGLAPNVSPVSPGSDLRNMQITPGSLLDRFALANQQFDTFSSSTNPQFEATLRDATRAAAGAGRLGSGMLRTSYGDLANQRDLQLQNARDTLFQNALAGSVQDAQTQFQDLLAEQSYQTGAQGQAFNQAVSAQQLQDSLTNSAFQRALATFIQGNANDPASALLTLSQMYGNQASAGSASIGNLMSALAGGGGNSATNSVLQQILNNQNQSQLLGQITNPNYIGQWPL